MSVAVCRPPAASPFQVPSWLSLISTSNNPVAGDDRPGQFDIWAAIQADKAKAADSVRSPPPYVHPLVRRSSSSMSQESLEICTESLGCETGFSFSSDDDMPYYGSNISQSPPLDMDVVMEPPRQRVVKVSLTAAGACEKKELTSVNYHCSSGARSPPRSFPPPLPSMSRQGGPCLQMRPHRRDGRLVVEAVPVPSHNYLHAQRHDGHLRLSFIDCPVREQNTESKNLSENAIPGSVFQGEQVQELNTTKAKEKEEEAVVEEEEEEEEEVEVLDRGTVVEVKVSTQPQQPSGKVHRSTLVINKFVGSTPLTTDQSRSSSTEKDEPNTGDNPLLLPPPPSPTLKRVPSTATTTVAAAVAAASTLDPASPDEYADSCGAQHAATTGTDTNLLFTSRGGHDKEELLRCMRRCSQLRRWSLFILEPYCIATS